MIRQYLEERIGPVTDREFELAGSVVKRYILEELGGSVRIELMNELMLHVAARMKNYRLTAWAEA